MKSIRAIIFSLVIVANLWPPCLLLAASSAAPMLPPLTEDDDATKDLIASYGALNKPQNFYVSVLQKAQEIRSGGNAPSESFAPVVAEAQRVLDTPEKQTAYNQLGHLIFMDLRSKNPQLIDYYNQLGYAEGTYRIEHLYNALVQGKNLQEGMQIAQITPIDTSNPPDTFNDTQKLIYKSLGKNSYDILKANQKDFDKLSSIVSKKLADGEPIDENFVRKVRIEQHIGALIQKAIEADQEKEKKKEETTDKDKEDKPKEEDKKKEEPKEKETNVEDFKKATPKLRSALKSIQNAKKYVSGINQEQLKVIKEVVGNHLQDYALLKQHADRIMQKKEAPEAKKEFAKLVQDIWKAARI